MLNIESDWTIQYILYIVCVNLHKLYFNLYFWYSDTFSIKYFNTLTELLFKWVNFTCSKVIFLHDIFTLFKYEFLIPLQVYCLVCVLPCVPRNECDLLLRSFLLCLRWGEYFDVFCTRTFNFGGLVLFCSIPSLLPS